MAVSLIRIAMACCLLHTYAQANLPRPRGVSISMASFYTGQTENFSCLDNSLVVPFDYVNDDYCDCPDGSDEPGTAACINGKFHCSNAGYIPNYIPSSRVNDGFCDCCDGSDEYSDIISCPNKCLELGKQAMEERMKVQKMQMEGFSKKQEYIKEGVKAKVEKKNKLVELETLRISADILRNDLEATKNEVEIPEKLAKETHEKAWEEEKNELQLEKEKNVAKDAFVELDTNKDQIVDVEELKAHSEFDIDSDGTVSDDEAKEYMEDVTDATHDHFMEKMWPNIKEIYRKSAPEVEETKPKVEATLPPPPSRPDEEDEDEDEGGDEEDTPPGNRNKQDDDQIRGPPVSDRRVGDEDEEDEGYEEDDYEDDGLLEPPEDYKKKIEEEPEKDTTLQTPEYDENTKSLIQAADTARANYNEADRKLRDIEKEISDVKKVLELDLGPENEYYVLYGNCFEYTDREYTYSFCPFERASQRSKSGGGMETSLGHWGQWDGPSEDIYKAQKYDKGQSCWNGPDRSVKVHFQCGVENELNGASEPSRCEYAFTFSTPTMCAKLLPQNLGHRDEL